jgi:hypothetical protein
LIPLLPPDENGFKPEIRKVDDWKAEFAWEDRANLLDAQTIQMMDTQIIDERIAMFREHAAIGAEIKDFGIEYLRTRGLNSDMAALRAISEGVQLERSSRGLAESLVRLAEMDDTKLLKEINRLLEAKQDVIDAETEDITDSADNK